MLIIISNRLSHNRKPKRQVSYQPDQGGDTGNRSMFDILKTHKDDDDKRKENLERRFKEKLRNTASRWQHSYHGEQYGSQSRISA